MPIEISLLQPPVYCIVWKLFPENYNYSFILMLLAFFPANGGWGFFLLSAPVAAGTIACSKDAAKLRGLSNTESVFGSDFFFVAFCMGGWFDLTTMPTQKICLDALKFGL